MTWRSREKLKRQSTSASLVPVRYTFPGRGFGPASQLKVHRSHCRQARESFFRFNPFGSLTSRNVGASDHFRSAIVIVAS
jgi:hypothetical protein